MKITTEKHLGLGRDICQRQGRPMDKENTFGKVWMPSYELSEKENGNYFTAIIVFFGCEKVNCWIFVPVIQKMVASWQVLSL